LKNSALELVKNQAAIITQLCLIASAVFVSFGLPFIFGLTAYGVFVATTALTFIIQKAIDLTIESILIEKNVRKLILSTAIAVGVAALMAAILNQIFPGSYFQIDYLLLAAMVASTSILNLIFMLGNSVWQMLYAALFVLASLAFTALFYLFGSNNITMLLVAINIVGTITGLGIVYGLRQTLANFNSINRQMQIERDSHRSRRAHSLVSEFLSRLLFSSLTLLVTFGSALIASDHLNAKDLGTLRLFASFIIVGYWLTPINPKTFYAIASTIKTPAGMKAFFDRYWIHFVTLLFVWFAGLMVVSTLFVDHDAMQYLAALCVYPCILFISVFDKSMLSAHGLKRMAPRIGGYAAIITIALINAETLFQHQAILIVAMTCYPLTMVLLLDRSFWRLVLLPIALTLCGAVLLYVPSGAAMLIATLIFLVIMIGLLKARLWTH
jgi:hypothetical protein|tara:strand:+ start:1016 stop:2335 length:1320 start_codon:yes stop_codon:yes gene_type:complete